MKIRTHRKVRRETPVVQPEDPGPSVSEGRVVASAPPAVPIPPQQPPPRRELLREAEVCARLRRHRSSIWRDVKSGILPAPVRIGRSVLWFAAEIDRFISSLRRATDSQ